MHLLLNRWYAYQDFTKFPWPNFFSFTYNCTKTMTAISNQHNHWAQIIRVNQLLAVGNNFLIYLFTCITPLLKCHHLEIEVIAVTNHCLPTIDWMEVHSRINLPVNILHSVFSCSVKAKIAVCNLIIEHTGVISVRYIWYIVFVNAQMLMKIQYLIIRE